MSDEELDEVKEKLEKSEFNNEEEDDEIIEKKQVGKNDFKIVVFLCIVIVILLLLIGFVLFHKLSRNENHNDASSSGSSSSESSALSKVDISKGESYFINDNYLYVIYDNKGYITNLDGKIIFVDEKLSCSRDDFGNEYILCEEKKSDSKVKNVIKRVDDNGVIQDVFVENQYGSASRKLYNEKNNLLGIYNENKNGTILYLLNNDSYFKNTLDKKFLFTVHEDNLNTKIIYNNQYAILTEDMSSASRLSDKSLYGLYDVRNNKVLVSPKYQEISYLRGDYFVAVKNGKKGIIDTNGLVKVDFSYDDIQYANGLYFVGVKNELFILDQNFKEISNSIPYYILEVKAFGDKVIVHKNRVLGEYAVVDKMGTIMNFDFHSFTIYGNYVITLKERTVTLYDSSFNKIQEFDLQAQSIDLDTAAVYLDSSLIFNGRKTFNIETGTYSYDLTNLSRSYQNYYVNLDIHGEKANATILLDDKQVGSMEDVDMVTFLKSENNGIRVTNQYFIFSNGTKRLILKR